MYALVMFASKVGPSYCFTSHKLNFNFRTQGQGCRTSGQASREMILNPAAFSLFVVDQTVEAPRPQVLSLKENKQKNTGTAYILTDQTKLNIKGKTK